MQHIVTSHELDQHKIEDHHKTECKCNPLVRINPLSGDMYVIHQSFNKDFKLTEEDIKGIFEFAVNDPAYEGGNIIVDEEDDEILD